MQSIVDLIVADATKADARYGPPASSHESYGVLCEEVAELFDAIRGNNIEAIRLEAIQVASVAIRLVKACEDRAFQDRSMK